MGTIGIMGSNFKGKQNYEKKQYPKLEKKYERRIEVIKPISKGKTADQVNFGCK